MRSRILPILFFITIPCTAQQLHITTASGDARGLYEEAVEKFGHFRTDEAGAFLKDAIEADSTFAMAHALLAHLQPFDKASGEGLAREAVRWAEGATPGERTYAEAVHAFAAGDSEKAMRLAREMQRDYPEWWLPTALLAQVQLFGVGDMAALEQDLRAGLAHHPEHNLLNNLLGYALRYQGKTDDAAEVFRENVRRYPDQPNPYDSMANQYRAMGRFEDAADYYEKSIEVDPDFTFGDFFGSRRNKLGYTYLQLGRFDEAERVLKENVQRRPESANAYDSLGELYLAMDRLDEAAEQFKKALQIEPGFEPSAGNLARVRIEEAYRDIVDAMEPGSPASIANRYYTSEAVLFPPGAGPARGRDAIEAVFAGMIESGLVVRGDPDEVEVYGDIAYEQGTATVQNEAGDVVATHPYVVLWKKEGDTWRMHRDFVSGTNP